MTHLFLCMACAFVAGMLFNLNDAFSQYMMWGNAILSLLNAVIVYGELK